MKAFDTITPAHYQKQKSLHQTSKRQYFVIDKKQSIQIPIKTKVQIQAISHQVRKPKVHIIKVKQLHVHIVESRNKNVLGFDTDNEEWGHQANQNLQQNHGGFFDGIRNANIFNRHNNQMQQQNIQYQQNPSANQPNKNLFQILKSKLAGQPQNQIIQQPPLINTLGFGLQNHLNSMQQQQITKSITINQQLSQPVDRNMNQVQRQVEFDRKNLQQSHVQQVHLQNISAAFPQQKLQQSISDRLLNFFKSFKKKDLQNQHQQQKNSLHQQHQNIRNKQNQRIGEISKSEVQKYQSPREQNEKPQHKMRIQESIVQQYHAQN